MIGRLLVSVLKAPVGIAFAVVYAVVVAFAALFLWLDEEVRWVWEGRRRAR